MDAIPFCICDAIPFCICDAIPFCICDAIPFCICDAHFKLCIAKKSQKIIQISDLIFISARPLEQNV